MLDAIDNITNVNGANQVSLENNEFNEIDELNKKHLKSIKTLIRQPREDDISIMDILLEYCMKKEVEYEEIGELVAEDQETKQLIYFDCVNRHIIKDDSLQNLDDW
jgi:hypothetical protein